MKQNETRKNIFLKFLLSEQEISYSNQKAAIIFRFQDAEKDLSRL